MRLLNRGFLLCLFALVLLAAWFLTPLSISPRSQLICIALILGILWAERVLSQRESERAATIMFGISIVLIVGWTAAAIHFAAMSLSPPEIDATLYAIDRALGLDWFALAAWLAQHPTLDLILGIAYASLLPQIIIVIVLLSRKDHKNDLNIFLSAYAMTLLGSAVIGALFPAHAMCRWSDSVAATYPEMLDRAACAFLPVYDGLRNGTLTEIDVIHIDGLITFPSFHTTAAILLAWAVRKLPVIGPCFAVLNLLMIAATPTFGGHYFIDIAAGALMAIAAILASCRTERVNRLIFNHAARSIAFERSKSAR